MAHLTDNSYGKGRVRLTKVVRRGALHDVLEFSVTILLEGDFARVYTHGDNASCVPTDTMKNTVFALAKKYSFDSPEAFAKLLAGHFVEKFRHVSAARVDIEHTPWKRISVGGKSHEHSFMKGCGVRTCSARLDRKAGLSLRGGVSGLEVLKSTNSAFTGFLRDEYTTLKDASERIFATTIDAEWSFAGVDADFNGAYETARQAILEIFATHNSLGVQQTIHAMGEAVLSRVPAVAAVSFTLPNQHRLLVNLEPFGMENRNEIFVATSEPFGLIKGTIERD